jgi:hypothetical protein
MGEQSIYPVTNFMQLRDIDLTRLHIYKNSNVLAAHKAVQRDIAESKIK